MSQMKVKANPGDILGRMGTDMYRRAYEEGVSLSAWLEKQDPSSEWPNDGLDAFGRVLRAGNVRTEAIPELGIQASTYDDFNATPQLRALIPEWLARIQREVQTGRPFNTRALYTSADGTPGSWERPYAEAQRPRWSRLITPAIPMSALVALTTTIDTDSYRSYYLQHDEAQSQMARVSEGAEVPRVKLVGQENTIDLHKFGRTMEATYEVLRRQRLDKIALHVRRMAVQAETDKVATIIDTMVNGDGNDNGATTYDLTTLDSDATAGTLTLKGWLAFKLKFATPYMMTGVLAQEDVALQMLLLDTGGSNIPLVTIQAASGFGSFEQINPGLRDNVALGWTADAPSLKIVAFDQRFGVERVVESGANISEVERFTTLQTQTLTFTEVEGYAILDENAVRALDVSA